VPKFSPFHPIFPASKELAQQITARSSDFDSQIELVKELKSNDFTWHHMTKKHLLSNNENRQPIDFVDEIVEYVEALWKKNGIVKSKEKGFLYYLQQGEDHRVGGIVGLSSLAGYQDGEIKIHEKTKINRQGFIQEIFRKTQLIGEPVLLTYTGQKFDLDRSMLMSNLILDFYSKDSLHHQIFLIEKEYEQRIQDFFSQISCFYVADGHHRTQTVYNYLSAKKKLNEGGLLSCLVHEDDLLFRAFHRKINVRLGEKKARFLDEIKGSGYRVERKSTWFIPKCAGEIVMLVDNDCYLLVKNSESDVIELEESILKKILGINNSRIDERIEFFPAKNLEELKSKWKDEKDSILFVLYPESFQTIRKIADKGEIMPPKSTYILPKFRGGMILHSL